MTHTPRRSLFLVSAALCAVFAASCGDPFPPAPAAGPVSGAPIAGAPIDGTSAAAAAPSAAEPTASARANVPAAAPAAVEPPAGATEPAAPSATETTGTAPSPAEPDVAEIPAIGDPTTRDERRPEDEPITTPAPAAPADVPSEIPPTTASQSAKPDLPDKPKPADAEANPGAATVDPKTGLKSFIPKDHKKDEPLVLSFEQLASYDYTPPPPPSTDPDVPVADPSIALEAAKKQIPHEIWELEGKVLSVEGYMIPLEYQDDGVKAFIISRHAMGCCFGIMPRPHEMIECDLGEGKSTPYVGYIPVIVTGTFRVSLPTGTQTMLTGIYKMDAPKISLPKER
jgi:hypothetical protein